MLTDDDVAWIRGNRPEIRSHRTKQLDVIRDSVTGSDPYTGEPTTSETQDTTTATWREMGAMSDWQYMSGVEVKSGDVEAVFDDTFDFSGVRQITSVESGIAYRVVSVVRRGLGGTNRKIALLRRVT